ncbi:trypsin 3A1-like [Anopheles marshallii]|uniref:trypsin 3A1-like n=1 Tax=Anopheles marshallii TaxID=1521116 RepID=UPI00237A404B|nr:trypsin 3A1-like [Anopheles marshallii]
MYILLKILQIVMLAGVLLPPSASSSENNETNMIVGAFKVNIEDVPYQVGLFHNQYLICGGTIIGPQWIVTAYHCVEKLDPAQYSFVVGTDDPYSGRKLKPKYVIVPEEMFVYENVTYDIALVLLEQPLAFSKNVQCLELLPSVDSLVPGKPAYISGFGASKEGGFDSPLKAATIDLLPESTCQNAYPKVMKGYMICAGFEQGMVDSCQGDSGGPLVVDGKLAGVIFYGQGCARPNKPGVYISIPFFRSWIVSVAHGQPNTAERKLCGDK